MFVYKSRCMIGGETKDRPCNRLRTPNMLVYTLCSALGAQCPRTESVPDDECTSLQLSAPLCLHTLSVNDTLGEEKCMSK